MEEDLAEILSFLQPLRDWPRLGDALGLQPSVLEAISIKNKNDRESSKREMVVAWIKTKAEVSIANIKDEIRAIASPIINEESREGMRPEPPKTLSPSINFKDSLKSYYKNQEQPSVLPSPFIAPPLPYTQLSLVPVLSDNSKEDNLNAKTPESLLCTNMKVTIQDVFSAEEIKKGSCNVLITGEAGAGKTTMVIDMCQQWANRKCFQRFKIVVYVPLKEFTGEVTLDRIVERYYCGSDVRQVAHELLGFNGLRTLFVLDGWDELPESMRRTSFFADLLAHSVLPLASVLVTSRAIAGPFKIFDHHFEVVGFTKPEIELCALNAFSENPQDGHQLVEYLRGHPAINSLCSAPLHLVIVVTLFRYRRESMPPTYTELYRALLLTLMIMHAKHSCISTDRLTSLDSLPDPMASEFSLLCKLAFTGIVEEKMCFSEDTLRALNYPLPSSSSPGLSLLHSSVHVVSGVPSTQYFFTHLSLQEFLASWHLHHLSSSEQLEIMKSYFSSARFKNVLLVQAGLTGLRCDEWVEFQSQAIHCFDLPLDETMDVGYSSRHYIGTPNPDAAYVSFSKKQDFTIVRHAYEARNTDVMKKVVPKFGNTIQLKYAELDHSHCLALGYFIAVSNQKWRVYLQWAHTDAVFFQNIQLGAKEAPPSDCSGQIVELWVPGLSSGSSALEYLNAQSQILSALRTVWLSGSKLGPQGARTLSSSLIRTGCLQSLELTLNEIGDEGVMYISDILKDNTSLRQLVLNSNQIGPDGARYLADALKTNSTLKSLFIGRNPLGSDGITIISSALMKNTSIVELSFEGCEGDPTITAPLAELITSSTPLYYLDISFNNLDSLSAKHIAIACAQSARLQTLMIMGNDFTDSDQEIFRDLARQKQMDIKTSRSVTFKNLSAHDTIIGCVKTAQLPALMMKRNERSASNEEREPGDEINFVASII